MIKLRDIVATLSRPSSLGTFNRAASMSFSSVRNSGGKSTIPAWMEAIDEDLESEENLINMYERWMRHTEKIRTDIEEKNRRFQNFKKNVMKRRSAGIFADTCKEEFTCMLGCNLPSIEVQSQVMSFEEWCAKEELEGTNKVTYKEMERRFLGRVD
ncbi:cysteine protease XCP2-like isoform X1 [Papaver somniferum]|nr:cysteine protease XCP2-like isoform X1 [Papaver somniferum]